MPIQVKYILPDLDTCKKVRQALLQASIQDDAIQFLAKPGTALDGLNITSTMESTNMVHEGGKGVLYGMLFGLVSGIYVLMFPLWVTLSPAWYTNAPWYVILGTLILIGGVSMAFAATLLGVNVFNSNHQKYKQQIEAGQILMILSVPLYKARKMRTIIKSSMMDKHEKTILLNQTGT